MRPASFALAIALTTVTACASGGTATPSGAPSSQSVGVVGPGGTVSVATAGRNESNVQTLPFTPDAVWRILPAVFDSLGIPVSTLDQVKHTIGNSGFAVRRRLKTTPLSRFIDCGQTQLGPNADDYDVRLTVISEVHPAEGGATVTTTVEASARPVNYAQEYSNCPSRGALEQRIIDALQARLAK